LSPRWQGSATTRVTFKYLPQPANSGGPLLDHSSNVVGVVAGRLNAMKTAEIIGDLPQKVNFAIKSRMATSFLDSNGVSYSTGSRGDQQSYSCFLISPAR
jgi:hypothetical protein